MPDIKTDIARKFGIAGLLSTEVDGEELETMPKVYENLDGEYIVYLERIE